MNKPKILFIGPLPPPYSGPELSMKQLLEADVLNEAFDIIFLKTNFRKDNVNKGRLDFSMISNFFIYFSKLLYSLLKYKPALVYYPITVTQVGWIGRDALTLVLSKIFGAKNIIHLRGSHFSLNIQKFHPIVKGITKFALLKTDVAIVQAKYLKNEFEPFLSCKKTQVLYQSIIVEEFDNPDILKYQRGKILIVGHLTKAKGYTDILKVIPEIANEFPEVQFCFAGNIRKGERNVFYNQVTREKLQYEDPFVEEGKITKSKYSKNYKRLGIISGVKKEEHFRTADIFVSASYSEGFSRSLLEAMTMGKPLIYTPVGAHREVLKNKKNGFEIQPGSREELINSIRLVLKNTKQRNKIALNNYKKAREEFAIEKIASDFRDIISSELKIKGK